MMESLAQYHDEMYEHLLAISRRALSEASFEVAYHSLTAAMHCAKDLKNVTFLREVLLEAEKQKKVLDTTYPEHSLSSTTAASRHHEGVYSSLQRQIGTALQFLEMPSLLQDLKQQENSVDERQR
jgi:hypothetical protein